MLTVPVHELATTEQFLKVLDGHTMKFEPGERFVYCSGAMWCSRCSPKRASGVLFHNLVEQRVCTPAGMLVGWSVSNSSSLSPVWQPARALPSIAHSGSTPRECSDDLVQAAASHHGSLSVVVRQEP